MAKKKNCNGCRANGSFCALQYKREYVKGTFGIMVPIPTEICPKPKTYSAYLLATNK